MITGRVTVAGMTSWVTFLRAYLDGRLVGDAGGRDPFGSEVLTVSIGATVGLTREAAAIEAGTHELVIVVGQTDVGPPPPNLYVTQSESRVNSIDRDTGEVLGTRALESQEVRLNSTDAIRWTIVVDASGAIIR